MQNSFAKSLGDALCVLFSKIEYIHLAIIIDGD